MVSVCPSCGKRVKAEKQDDTDSYTSYQAGAAAEASAKQEYTYSEPGQSKQETAANRAYTYKQEYQRRYGNAGQDGARQNSAAQTKVTYEDEDISRNKAISYLCYFGPLFLIPYLTCRDSDFVRFHSNQGLLLLLACVITNACSAIPVIGWIIWLAGVIFGIGGFFGGLINVSKGIKKSLPIIGEIQILK
jgi:uncharacterized membrane protein/uncharacterized Zn finger protein (UPF0148 family)